MKWFRLYAEFATDPKIQSMSETFQRRYIMFLCLKCNGELEKLTEEEICCALRITTEELRETKEAFIRKGFIDENYRIIAWEKRQYVSDNVNDRVKKHREKMKQECNVTETFQHQNGNVSVTPPDTDTDTDTDTDNTPPISPPTGDGVGNPKNQNLEKPDPIETELFGDGGLWNLWLTSRRGTKDEVRKAYRAVRRAGNVAAIRTGVEEYMRSAYVTSRIEVGETSTIKTLPAWLRAKRWEEIGTGAWDEPCFTWKARYKGNGSNYVGPCKAANLAPRDGTLTGDPAIG
ncbi:MAG TPA: hypothetical protein PKH75_13020 [Bacillota bacterium]|nr:hypothetical protein [Bacillota bacterium]